MRQSAKALPIVFPRSRALLPGTGERKQLTLTFFDFNDNYTPFFQKVKGISLRYLFYDLVNILIQAAPIYTFMQLSIHSAGFTAQKRQLQAAAVRNLTR
ncbi:hypothetical protein VN24_12460 [Paenibacillus beijingensis]|uniref:Uncharacterized protein n=1 Tax=Paenibacillus beijingensis TaxID=1126833 RepID=A0A0D5NIP3_9BACL|nr:hypothetical protein VN24_12460 [Paenibacillus beijingensis]